MKIQIVCWALALVMGYVQIGSSRETSKSDVPSNRELLMRLSTWYVWSGGMLQHTAFHNGLTTRYLWLKAALHLPPLAEYLELDADQKNAIRELRPVDLDAVDDAVIEKNDQPDEQFVDPDYFHFQRPEQLEKLDIDRVMKRIMEPMKPELIMELEQQVKLPEGLYSIYKLLSEEEMYGE